jgi:Flp pilus assembly pilin Flp
MSSTVIGKAQSGKLIVEQSSSKGQSMTSMIRRNESGQAFIEYTLLLALLLLGVVAALTASGSALAANWDRMEQAVGMALAPKADDAQVSRTQDIMDDFLQRMQEFYDAQGRWPRSWGDYRFTDIGYDPADWDEAVEGIFWNPNGYRLGLANYAGDNLQIYVNDLEGNTLHLYDGWNIWCLPGGGCYYHTVAPGNEVDIDTLLVVDLTSGLAQ